MALIAAHGPVHVLAGLAADCAQALANRELTIDAFVHASRKAFPDGGTGFMQLCEGSSDPEFAAFATRARKK